jgi:hypothetical protein
MKKKGKNNMNIQNIAKEILQNYPNGIKIWQLQEEAKYFGVDANILFKKICNICQTESEADFN